MEKGSAGLLSSPPDIGLGYFPSPSRIVLGPTEMLKNGEALFVNGMGAITGGDRLGEAPAGGPRVAAA
jgi:hypothetical protein